MIANISPEAQYTDESISTCHFAQRVALIKNSASVNEKVDPELVIQRLRAEVRRLREEVDFLSGKNDDDEASGDRGEENNSKLSQELLDEMTESIKKYVHKPDTNSHLDFCGGITLPKIHAACSIFKDMLLRKSIDNAIVGESAVINVDGNGSADGDEEDSVVERQPSRIYFEKNKQGTKVGSQQLSATHRANVNKTITQQTGITKSSPKTVRGVPICRDKRTIEEPTLAFEWFKERYPGLASIDESKHTLKMKYTEVICRRRRRSSSIQFAAEIVRMLT